jgi:hypothetical protein
MKSMHVISFFAGALVMLAVSTLSQSKASTSNHVYELRVYHAAAGKLDALKARFADHTDAIFKKHNLKSIGYWVPEDNKDNLFIYIVEHPSKAEADKNWDAFQKDPEWVKVKADSEVNGSLATKVDRTFMDPTEFSKLK